MTTVIASAARQPFTTDFHRPFYHFLPPSNWMNDPNGVIQWKGKYHLFYQHNPNSPLWGDMHWGHAVSDNLIHWTDLPLALAPTPGGPDEAGVFSGCAVNNNGQPTIIYTGTRGEKNEIQTQCIAFSNDDLRSWQKHPANPVIHQVPSESRQTRDFRDPFVWREHDGWYMVLGSCIQDVGGAIFLYRSDNLIDWDYLGPLLVGDIKRNGHIWECPNFFKLGDQWVLIISSHLGTATGTVIYFVGTFENHHFTPLHEGVLDYGALYAPLTFVDDQQRRVLYGWLRETRSPAEQQRAGWSGVQCIPRRLSLDNHGRLNMQPVHELEAIRVHRHQIASMDIEQEMVLDVRGMALDIVADFSFQVGGNCGIAMAVSADGKEHIDILYESAEQCLVIRKVSPDMGDSLVTHLHQVPHELVAGESLRLRILLDGSVIEVIANGRTSLTSRNYPSDADHNRLRLFGTKTHLISLNIWEMASIWQ